MPDFTQPDQQFSLQEVAQHCGLAPYIIRYWEIHFPQLAGLSGGTKSSYTSNDVALIWRIKKLLYVDHLTIDQAKAQLAAEQAFPVQYPGFAAGQNSERAQPDLVEKTQEQEHASEPAIEEVNASPAPENEPEPAQDCEEVPVPVQTQPQTVEVVKEVERIPEETLLELKELRERVEMLTSEVESLTAQKSALAKENDELKDKLSNYENAQAGLDAAQSTLVEENAKLKTTVNDVLSQLKEVSLSLAR